VLATPAISGIMLVIRGEKNLFAIKNGVGDQVGPPVVARRTGDFIGSRVGL
jgi:hypothetical protein